MTDKNVYYEKYFPNLTSSQVEKLLLEYKPTIIKLEKATNGRIDSLDMALNVLDIILDIEFSGRYKERELNSYHD